MVCNHLKENSLKKIRHFSTVRGSSLTVTCIAAGIYQAGFIDDHSKFHRIEIDSDQIDCCAFHRELERKENQRHRYAQLR